MSLPRVKLLVWALGLLGFFLLLTLFVPKLQLLTVLNGIFLGVVVSAIIVYLPLIAITVHKTKLDRVSQLALGVGLLFCSIAGQKLYWIVWRAYGSQASWQSNYLLSGLTFIAIIGGCLFATAPGYPPANVSTPVDMWGANRRLLVMLGLLGGIATFAVSVYTGETFN